MLCFFSNSGDKLPLQHIVKNYCLTRKNDGNNVLSFNLDTDTDEYKMISGETVIDDGENQYLVKKINGTKFECSINLDFLKSTVYASYSSDSKTLSETLRAHLPAGWSIFGANVRSAKKTIEFDYCTDYDIVQQCMDTFDVCFVWNTVNKSLTVVDTDSIQPSGEYLTDELNLRSVSYKSETTSFITRLYAYGEDGMTFASINGDKEYVEDFTYSSKIVCGYWSDNRYTVKENLLEATKKKLKDLSSPVTTYECDVIDIAKQKPDEYSFLDFQLHKVVTLIDRDRGVKVNHHIVQYKEYPDEPDRNVITLSAVPETITSSIQKISSEFTEAIGENKWTLEMAVKHATEKITYELEGHVYIRHNEILIMDTEDPNTAKGLWRWTYGGLGFSSTGYDGTYALALTNDGQIVADRITAGELNGVILKADSVQASAISQEFKSSIANDIEQTHQSVVQEFTIADGELKSSIFQTLESYSTTTEVNSLIEQKANSIALSVTTTELSKMDIGCTQMLRGTNSTSSLTASGNWKDGEWRSASGGQGTRTSIDVTDSPNANIKKGWELAHTSGNLDIAQDSVPVQSGTTYTMSCYAKGTGILTFQYGKNPFPSKSEKLTDVQKWTRYSYTFTIGEISDGSADGSTNIYFGNRGTGTIKICGMKLEKGNQATDWTEAFSDYSTTPQVTAAIEVSEGTIKAYVDSKAVTTENNSKDYVDGLLESYSTTTQMNTAISSSADSITLSVSKTYETIENVDKKVSDAQDNSNAYTVEQLKSYYTATQTDAAIQASADSITLSVSETYETIDNVTKAKNDAITESGKNADTKLEAYYTKTETDSAISVSKTGILSTVSETYYTKESASSLTDRVVDAESAIEQNASEISLRVTKSGLVSEINASSGTISMKSNRFTVSSTNFTLTAAGNITANNATLNNATITGDLKTTDSDNDYYTYIHSGMVEFFYNSKRVAYLMPVGSTTGIRQFSILGSGNYDGVAIGAKYDDGIYTYYRCNIKSAYTSEGCRHHFVGTVMFDDKFQSNVNFESNLGISWGGNIGLRYANSSGGVDRTGVWLGISNCPTILTGTEIHANEKLLLHGVLGGMTNSSTYQTIISHSSSAINVGNTNVPLYLKGSNIYTNGRLKNTLDFESNIGVAWGGNTGLRYYNGSSPWGLWVGIDDCATVLTGTSVECKAKLYTASGTEVTSDRRKKNSIKSLDDRYISMIDLLDAKLFKYNEQRKDTVNCGFIAQEVLEAMNAVGLSENEFGAFDDIRGDGSEYALDYMQFIPILWETVKALNRRIKALERTG